MPPVPREPYQALTELVLRRPEFSPTHWLACPDWLLLGQFFPAVGA